MSATCNNPPSASVLWRTARFLAVSAAALAIGACDVTEPVSARPAGPSLARAEDGGKLKAPKLETKAPRYPAVAVYIVYREYLHLNPGLTSLDPDDKKYQKYMEKRLRELYPQNGGYDGMMAETGQALKAYRAAYAQYEREKAAEAGIMVDCEPVYMTGHGGGASIQTCGGSGGGGGPTYESDVDASWNGNYEYSVPSDYWVPTIQEETDSLQLAPTEVQQLSYYESLAAQVDSRDNEVQPYGSASSRDDLIRAAAVGQTSAGPSTQSVVYGVIGGAVITYVGWHAYRAITADERAKKMSTHYFGYLHEQNTKRDAYRHIFWSMQLRRYVGGPMAKGLTDYYEHTHPGPNNSTAMDLHNNDVGREYKYHRFRGHWFWDRNDSSEWAQKIYYYVNDSATWGVFISEWSTEPTVSQAQYRESLVDNGKYIWFSNQPA